MSPNLSREFIGQDLIIPELPAKATLQEMINAGLKKDYTTKAAIICNTNVKYEIFEGAQKVAFDMSMGGTVQGYELQYKHQYNMLAETDQSIMLKHTVTATKAKDGSELSSVSGKVMLSKKSIDLIFDDNTPGNQEIPSPIVKIEAMKADFCDDLYSTNSESGMLLAFIQQNQGL